MNEQSIDKETMIKKFRELYGGDGGEVTVFAPGRVNLIGEHIDYNGGLVFPCALDMGTMAVSRKRNDGQVSFASLNFDLKKTISLEGMVFDKNDQWMNYPKGVIDVFRKNGYTPGGFDVLFYGNIPNGSGLSSSASIEVATAVTMNALFSFGIDMVEMVKLTKKAENEFVGVNCGIMDMFAVGMGRKDMAIALDCNSLKYEYVPLLLEGCKLVISNTNKKRGLADSKYNERRRECDESLSILKKFVDAEDLCSIPFDMFLKYKDEIKDEVLIKRTTHVISEHARVKAAIKELSQNKNVKAFGSLMNQSHVSLREDYEVTGFELDTLVEESWKVDGVIGSRMTGAGFGGCTISIVDSRNIDEFKRKVGENYFKKTGIEASFYVATIGDGAGVI